MIETNGVSLRQYYAAFGSISGVIAGFLSAAPLLTRLLPSGYSGYGFPPLGGADGPARVGTFVLALAMTYVAFFAQPKRNERNRRNIVVAILMALIPLFLYVGLSLRFVRTIEIPSTNTSVQVSVGYERTKFAADNFTMSSDWEMLRARGTDEEEVWKLWTASSLITSRLSLYLAYSLFVLLLVAGFSWGVLLDVRQGPRHALSSKPPETSR
jgi:hypothetical protein